ncbi:hypothetical protein [Aurantiacibacter sediminis]|uniref:DUF1254 domain-containing protein n=1 Tax=Aurantiacibacter sediminis TaxID=2793064 RepID=A0ABS0N255_9SPHN|nr:hypothetical protein [Aurantiacibacter sediminis]MBH5321104.1 hypothetical protein [Aurantiacibacter sediminis]
MISRICMAAALALSGAMLVSPTAAQEAISLAEGEAYEHPHSDIAVPAMLGGLPRTDAAAYAEDQLDIGMNFESADRSQILSFYVFRNTNGALPVWFAQAESVIAMSPNYDNPERVLGPRSFALSGAEAQSGLITIFEPGPRNGMRSTGVAMFAVGEWYVKMRASSATRTSDGLLHWMEGALAELQLPDHDAVAVAPIGDCEDELRFRGRSRDVRGDAADNVVNSLLGGLLQGLVEEQQEEAGPVTWCRDSQLHLGQAVYRANESETSYLLALGDNGNAVRVSPQLHIEGINDRDNDDEAFSITLYRAAGDVSFVTQDRLPSPERVLELLNDNRVTSSRQTWGEGREVTINSDILSE